MRYAGAVGGVALGKAWRAVRAGLVACVALATLGWGAAMAAPVGAERSAAMPGEYTLAQNSRRQNLVRIQSRWKSSEFLNVERGRLVSSGIEQGWNSAMWTIERVRGEREFVRIRNYWKPERVLNVESGELRAGPIQEGWFSAMWIIEPAEAGSVRIRNRYHPDQYLNIESGRIVSGPIQQGWWSAMWYLPPL